MLKDFDLTSHEPGNGLYMAAASTKIDGRHTDQYNGRAVPLCDEGTVSGIGFHRWDGDRPRPLRHGQCPLPLGECVGANG